MVWHRTVIRLAERADVHPALKKLWKKHTKVNGLVTQHLSPFEQQIVEPMLTKLPQNFAKKAMSFICEAGPGLLLGYAVYAYGEYKHKEIAYHHRP